VARPDRPPGRERDGGPAAEPDRHYQCRNPAARSDAEVIHNRVADGADIGQRRRAAWLRLSDERDLWLRRVLDGWREGYACGRASVLGGCYAEAYDLGFDHGYGATQAARAFVRGVIDGYEEGLAERHRMLGQIRDRDRIRHLAGKAAAR
jgi:hypothetical protein